MRLNNWSIAASYVTARIAVSYEFAGLGFGSSSASRSIISRPRRFAMKAVCSTLEVARTNVTERAVGRPTKCRGRPPQSDEDLVQGE
jgi:hypothetical protein